MSDQRPVSSRSGVTGDRASISGIGAALVLHKLLPKNPRRELLHAGLSGERLAVALEVLEALRGAATIWHEEATSARGHGDEQGTPAVAESDLCTTSEAALVLDVSSRQVRRYIEEGSLIVVARLGGRLLLDRERVAAFHRHRSKKAKR